MTSVQPAAPGCRRIGTSSWQPVWQVAPRREIGTTPLVPGQRLDLHADSGSTSGHLRTDPASPRSITTSVASANVSVAYTS